MLAFLCFLEVLERFRKVREAYWNNFLLVSSQSDLILPSYVQKTEKLTSTKETTLSM